MASPPWPYDASHGPRVWFLEPFAHVPLPAWAIGLLISLIVAALQFAIESAYIGTDPAHRALVVTAERIFSMLAEALLLGCIPTVVIYTGLAAERTHSELRPLWQNSDAELDALRAEQPSPTTRGFWLAGLAGAIAGTLLASYWTRYYFDSSLWLFQGWAHHGFWIFGYSTTVWTMAAQALYLWVSSSGGNFYDRVSWDLDLLDLRSLAPLERQRVTQVLIVIVMISIISLNMLDDIQRTIVIPLGILLFYLAIITAMLRQSRRTVQHLISRLKQEELERVGAAISGDRSALSDSRLAAQAETLSLADLLAYRDAITSVREWPVRSSTSLRVLLLLMIPLVGWIGGALVERVIGSLLDRCCRCYAKRLERKLGGVTRTASSGTLRSVSTRRERRSNSCYSSLLYRSQFDAVR